MGVDCDICLPHTARIRDVADVLATLAGAPGHMRPLRGSGEPFEVFVSDATIKIKHYEGGNLDSCLDVEIYAPPDMNLITGTRHIGAMWFFDFSVGSSVGGLRYAHHGRGFKGRSTGFWIAAARGLIDFFGGWTDFNDCDDIEIDYFKQPKRDLAAHDGAPYDAFQKRKGAVKPLTKADLAWAEQYASYKDAGALR
jgi:hypothetical protein